MKFVLVNMNQDNFQRSTISHVFMHLHIKLHVHSDFATCANIYLQKLKTYLADKKKQISGNYKIKNVQNMNIRQKFHNSKSTEVTRNTLP